MNPPTIEILQKAIERGDVFINENDKSVELHLRRLNLWHIFGKGDKLVISDWDEELGCFVVARKFIRSGDTGYGLIGVKENMVTDRAKKEAVSEFIRTAFRVKTDFEIRWKFKTRPNRFS